jgi:hypothetical protein
MNLIRLKPPSSRTPLLIAAGLWLAGAAASYGGEPPVDAMEWTAAYQEWISAVEAASGEESGWAFPFAAPRPIDLTPEEMKTVLSLRRLVRNMESKPLAALVETVARRRDDQPAQLRFWLAFAQRSLGLDAACQSNLRQLLLAPGSWRNLEPGQMVWVLTGFADLCFLRDERETAAALYGQLAASPREQLNLWGQYQLAGLDFLARNFTEASRRYQVVCDSEKSGTWREHACAMGEIAGRLDSLALKGGSHGRIASAAP